MKKIVLHRTLLICVLILGVFGITYSSGIVPKIYADSHNAALIKVDGVIDASVAHLIERSIEFAKNNRSEMLIIELNTPGGLYDSTRDIVELILMSEVPIVVFVSPDGAQAASAGTFITASAHIAAMSMTSNIGAASPVSSTGETLPDTMDSKAKQDAAAFIRSIAKTRSRNVNALEETVLISKSYTASEALEFQIIDMVVNDLDDLLTEINGKTVEIENKPILINSNDLEIVTISKSFVEHIISFLSSPTVIFLFITIGSIAVLIEVISGGGLIISGIFGILLLVLAFIGIGDVPVNWGGLILIIASMLLFYCEVFLIPGTTIFGFLGTLTLIFGGFLLFGDFSLPGFDQRPITSPNYGVNIWVLLTSAGVIFAVITFVIRDIRRAQIIGLTKGKPTMSFVGQSGFTTTDLSPEGEVHIANEMWTAVSETGEIINKGDPVKVLSMDGLTLRVSKVDKKCSTCGNQQLSSAEFCGTCGNQLGTDI